MSRSRSLPQDSSPSGPWRINPSLAAEEPTWSEKQQQVYLQAFEELKAATPQLDQTGPLRVAFVGQRSYFGPASLPDQLPGLHSSFVDYSFGDDITRAAQEIRAIAPHVVVAFRPEKLTSLLGTVGPSLRIGMFTEPVASKRVNRHADLRRRRRELHELHPNSCNLYIGFNPLFAEAWSSLVELSSCMPIPVRDDIYINPNLIGECDISGGIFVGRVTERRNHFLAPLKHHFEWTVVDHGLRNLDDVSIAVNLHNEKYANYENRVSLHLARGHLVLTEPLQPMYELHEGLNILNFQIPSQLQELVESIEADPARYRQIAIRGRLAADSFRASRLWPDRLVDLASSL
jgi:hypothetical protein